MEQPTTIRQDVLNLHGLHGLEGPVDKVLIEDSRDNLERAERLVKRKAEAIAGRENYDLISPGLKLIDSRGHREGRYLVRQHFEFYNVLY